MTALFYIVVIFVLCTAVAALDELVDRWSTGRRERRRREAQRWQLRIDTWSQIEEQPPAEINPTASRRVW